MPMLPCSRAIETAVARRRARAAADHGRLEARLACAERRLPRRDRAALARQGAGRRRCLPDAAWPPPAAAPISTAATWCWSPARNSSAGPPSAARCWCRRACRMRSTASDGIAPGLLRLCEPQRLAEGLGRPAVALCEPRQFRPMAALGSGAGGDRRLLPGARAFRARALRELRAGIESLIALSPSLRLIGPATGRAAADDEEFRAAHDLSVHDSNGRAGVLSAADCRVLHRALAQDLSDVHRRQRGRPRRRRAPLPDRPAGAARAAGERADGGAAPLRRRAARHRDAGRPDAAVANEICMHELDRVADVVAKIELLLAHTAESGSMELSHGILGRSKSSEAARAECADRIGMAKLAKLAFDGGDLRPIWAELSAKLLERDGGRGRGARPVADRAAARRQGGGPRDPARGAAVASAVPHALRVEQPRLRVLALAAGDRHGQQHADRIPAGRLRHRADGAVCDRRSRTAGAAARA